MSDIETRLRLLMGHGDRGLVVVDVLHWTGGNPGQQVSTAAMLTVQEGR